MTPVSNPTLKRKRDTDEDKSTAGSSDGVTRSSSAFDQVAIETVPGSNSSLIKNSSDYDEIWSELDLSLLDNPDARIYSHSSWAADLESINYRASIPEEDTSGTSALLTSYLPQEISLERSVPDVTDNSFQPILAARYGGFAGLGGQFNTIQPRALDVGVITWNINHFKSKVTVLTNLQSVNREVGKVKEKLRKAQDNLQTLDAKKLKNGRNRKNPLTKTVFNERKKKLEAAIANHKDDLLILKTNRNELNENEEVIREAREDYEARCISENERVAAALARKKNWLGQMLGEKHAGWLDLIVLQEINASNVESLNEAIAAVNSEKKSDTGSGEDIEVIDDNEVLENFEMQEDNATPPKPEMKFKIELGAKMTNVIPSKKGGSGIVEIADDEEDDDEQEAENEADGEDDDEEAGEEHEEVSLPPLKKNKTVSSDDKSDTPEPALTAKQQEYYPLIYNSENVEWLKSTIYYGKTEGPDSTAGKAEQEKFCRWSKNPQLKAKGVAGWRPIIVHRVNIISAQKIISIAVIHTSPKGKKLGRMGEFEQLSEFLDFVSEDSKKGNYWILAGDYYLDPESTITSNSATIARPVEDMFKTKVAGLGLDLITTISATNQTKLALRNSDPRNIRLQARAEKVKDVYKYPRKFVSGLSKRKNPGEKAIGQRLETLLPQNKRAAILPDVRKEISRYSGLTAEFKDYQIDSSVRVIDSVKRHVVNKRADFFIGSSNFKRSEVGVVVPTGGLYSVDTDNKLLNWWMKISDHAPVGAVFTVNPNSIKLAKVREDENLLRAARLEELKQHLREIQSSVLQKIAVALIELNDITIEMLHEWEELSDPNSGIAVECPMMMKYCRYLESVLNEPKWQLIKPPTPRLDFSGEEIVTAHINDYALYSYLNLQMNKSGSATDSATDSTGTESLGTILQKSFNLLAGLGYLCFDPERIPYKIEDYDLSNWDENFSYQ